jgi:hypothetical protein
VLGEARKNLPYLLPMLVLDDVQTQARNVQWEEEMEWEEEMDDDYDDEGLNSKLRQSKTQGFAMYPFYQRCLLKLSLLLLGGPQKHFGNSGLFVSMPRVNSLPLKPFFFS